MGHTCPRCGAELEIVWDRSHNVIREKKPTWTPEQRADFNASKKRMEKALKAMEREGGR